MTRLVVGACRGTYGLELGLEDPFDDTEVMDSSDADEKHDDDAVDSVSESESISASASETLRSRRVGIRMGRRARTHGLGFAKGRWRAMEGIFVGRKSASASHRAIIRVETCA